MTTKASVIFRITEWNEQPIYEQEGVRKMTRALVSKTYEGISRGKPYLKYLMVYRNDNSANFVGLERITGNLDGRSGSFVLQHVDTFENGISKAVLSVVPGSGTDELEGLKGEGDFEVGHSEKYALTLVYGFDSED
jgi:hypothetical protein